jgi:hypothetical protein
MPFPFIENSSCDLIQDIVEQKRLSNSDIQVEGFDFFSPEEIFLGVLLCYWHD